MKKEIILIALFIIFLNSVYAISSDLKAEYEKGETIIAEISGNILEPIDSSQIEFRRGHVAVPVIYDFKKLGDKYFLWAIAPNIENNYTFLIKDVATNIDGKFARTDFAQNFSILNNVSEYNVNPGFVSTSKDFSINIQLNIDKGANISVGAPEREVVLKPGKNEIKFELKNFNKGLNKINVGKYSILVYNIGNASSGIVEENLKIRIEPNAIISTVLENNNLIYPFKIVNFGNELFNVNFEYDEKLFEMDNKSLILEANKSMEMRIKILSKENVDDGIKIKLNSKEIRLPIIIKFTENESEAETPYLEGEVMLYCSELKGIICSADEICDGRVEPSIDGACCLAKCSIRESGGKSWIGYLITGVVLLGALYLYYRYKNARGKNFEERIASSEKN